MVGLSKPLIWLDAIVSISRAKVAKSVPVGLEPRLTLTRLYQLLGDVVKTKARVICDHHVSNAAESDALHILTF